MGVFGAAAATASAETVSMVLLAVAVWRAQGEILFCFGVSCFGVGITRGQGKRVVLEA